MMDDIEQQARIEKLYAELDDLRAKRLKLNADLELSEAQKLKLAAETKLSNSHDSLTQADLIKRLQEIKFGPSVLIFTGMGAATALIGAGAALALALHNWT